MYITGEVLEEEPRKPDSHKGDHGRVLVVAGSTDYAGAAVLTANACEAVLRSGADLAIACCPEKVGWLVNEKLPDAIVHKFEGEHFDEEHVDRVIELASDCDVLLIGPGLGEEAVSFAGQVIEAVEIPKVIDADAIHVTDLNKVEDAVITPHEKEFEALLENSGMSREDFQEQLGSNVVLLKGEVDKIFSKEEVAKNQTGNAVMTKGGTGDVLAGFTAGFIAQDNSLFKAACMAAYLNGAVGDWLQEEVGKTFTASEIIENLHRVYQ